MTETTAAPAIAEAKPNHGLSLADAVAQMQAARVNATQASPPAAPAEEPAADASNPEPGETAEADSVEGGEPEAEATADETAEEVTEEPSGEGVELAEDSKLILPDGSEWTAKELAEGVLRHKDYTKKTQALAEERRTLDADRKVVQDKARELETRMQAERAQIATALKEAQAQRDRYAQSVDEVEKALNQQGAEWARIDWEIEAQRDPNWQLKFARFQKWQHAMEVTRAEKAELDAKRKADAETVDRQSQEAAQTAWLNSRQTLEQHIASQHAELMDPAKAPQKFRAMMATAEAAGMPKEVFVAAMGHAPSPHVPVMHPAVFELLRKATLYDGLVAEQTKVLASDKAPKPDATGKIKVVKAGAPRFRPPSPTDSALGRAVARFKADPSPENAVLKMQAERAALVARQR